MRCVYVRGCVNECKEEEGAKKPQSDSALCPISRLAVPVEADAVAQAQRNSAALLRFEPIWLSYGPSCFACIEERRAR